MKRFKRFTTVLLVAYVIVMAVNLTANYDYYTSGHDWKFSVFFSLGVTTIGCLGYLLLYEMLFRKMINWKKRPNTSLLFAVAISGVYGILLMVLVMKILVLIFNGRDWPMEDYISNCTYSALFSMLIGLIVTGTEFLRQWKSSAEHNERMKGEMIRSQYEALKSQVNPHFLFNSLNTLAAIIPEKPEVAVDFVQQLSKVFRYALEYTDENMVTVSTELKIVRSYLFLNTQRFDGKLRTEILVSEDVMERRIITQSLLMLVENAIKHNEISTLHPLTLTIAAEGDYLTVQNTLRRKQVPEPSTHIGLKNIKSRYELVTKLPVIEEETADMFTVKIPLIK